MEVGRRQGSMRKSHTLEEVPCEVAVGFAVAFDSAARGIRSPQKVHYPMAHKGSELDLGELERNDLAQLTVCFELEVAGFDCQAGCAVLSEP